MRRLAALVSFALVLSSVAVLKGQTVPREPVITIPRGGGSPAPTPTPLPDPSGVYVGTSSFQVSGVPGTFNQTWRIDLQTRSCPDCNPGQYYVHSTNFNALVYASGLIERGGVYGSVNPNGRAFDLSLRPVNCVFLNPYDDRPTGGGYRGDLRGGRFGESSSGPLNVLGGTISGRVSGRDCFGRLLTANVTLQRQPGVPVLSCSTQIAGRYTGTYANSCGGVGSGGLTVFQDGCYFIAVDDAGIILIDGAMTSSSTSAFSVQDLRCPGDILTGTASRGAGGTITGSYTGTSSGAPTCCPAGPISGSFTLTPD